MTGLKRPLFELHKEAERPYGGAQQWFSKNYLRKCGCGVIACANILAQKEIATPEKREVDMADYMKIANRLKSFYLPIIPGQGINGWVMSLGINLYFLIHRLPYRAFWGVSAKKMDARIERMLSEDTPVCFSIGPNFPNLFGKKMVRLYSREGDKYVSNSEINGHYVSVTGMDDAWYEISTWGRKMYVKREEFREYVKKHSCSLFSNVLVVRHK